MSEENQVVELTVIDAINQIAERLNHIAERVQELSDNQDQFTMALGAIVDVLDKNNMIPEQPKQ